jgi:CoA:oxalate CoA-transferase
VTPASEAALPLKGIRVLDLTRIYSGPYCTFLMAMAGADVLKIESPDGEQMRHRPPGSGPLMQFPMLNANKRFLTLDFKRPEGREILLRLAERCDVLTENFRPGVMDKLGLGRDVLRKVNPRLIYASTNGFSGAGPYRDYAAMDLTIQALSGVMASTGFPENGPVRAGPQVGDFFAGVHFYGAVVTALVHRERTGEALAPEVAMLDAVYPSLTSNLGALMSGKPVPPRTGNHYAGMSSCPYNVYPAADGHFAIICVTERHWPLLLQALGREDLNQPQYATKAQRGVHMDEIDTELSKATATMTRAELTAKLNALGVPCGAVQTLPELVRDPHLRETGMLHDEDLPEFGKLTLAHSALTFRDHPRAPYRPAASLGADNADVFAEIGLGADDLARLKSAGVI